jgi:uncharacterized protein YcbK (DUF882 family)
MRPFKIAARAGLALCVSFNIAALPAAAQTVGVPHRHDVSAPSKKPPAKKPATTPSKPTMTLQFYNVHTGERLTLTRHKGDALPQSAAWFMRDYRRNITISMNPKLFDLLGKLQEKIREKHPALPVTFNVVSSYRSEETNENLRDAGGSQAQHSQHILGKAMDIRVPGVSTTELRDLATCLKGGGVGFYAEDQFVHVDVARVRYWPSHDYLSQLNCNKPKAPVVASYKPRNHTRRG